MNLIPVATQEECAEVIQGISKVFRFGLTQTHPDTGVTNKQHLEVEIGQLKAMIDLLTKEWDLDTNAINYAYNLKLVNYNKWDKQYGVLK